MIAHMAVFMPPGSAVRQRSVSASHTTELAEKWGRRIRNLIPEQGAEDSFAMTAP
jgi:hypothetical protein